MDLTQQEIKLIIEMIVRSPYLEEGDKEGMLKKLRDAVQ